MKKFITAIFGVVLIIVVFGYIFYFRPNYYLYNGGKIEFTSEIRQELRRNQYVKMIAHGDAIYYCSREGVEKKNVDGKSEWTKPFQLLSPLFIKSGDYFLVADIMGHEAYIFHATGHIGSIRENLPIVSASLSKEGQVALVFESDLENRIKLYNKEGLPLVERGSVLNQDGYPIAVAISDNGEHMITSYTDVLKGDLISNVTMFSFADHHENLDEFIVKAERFQGELVPEVYFFGERSVWLVGTSHPYYYLMSKSKEVYGELQKLSGEGDILSVHYTEDEIIFLRDTKKESEDRYQIEVFRWDGKKEAELIYAEEPLFIRAEGKHFFVVTDSQIFKYQGGEQIWEYPFHEPIEDIHQIDKENYLVIQPLNYTVLRVKKIY